MNHGPQKAQEYTKELSERLTQESELLQDAEFCLFPPFLSIFSARQGLSVAEVSLGVQNVNDHDSGAYTGEVSVSMALEAQCRYAIVGHSERRGLFHESPEFIGAKVQACCNGGLIPVICVGETLEEREAGQTKSVVNRQLEAALRGIEKGAQFLIAYEPVWAIGTGRAAGAKDAEELCRHIKEQTDPQVPVLYGGSVNSANSAELFSQPSVDGGLIGGASLTVENYLAILQNFRDKS